MAKLGKHQIDWLAKLASPNTFCIYGDKVTDSLVRRGLCVEHVKAKHYEVRGGYIQITPAGLRALADAWEQGDAEFLPPGKMNVRKALEEQSCACGG